MRRSAQLVATRMRSSCIHTQDFMRRGGGLSALTTRIRSAEMAPGCSTCWRGFAAVHRSLLDLLDLPPSTPRDEVRKKYLDAVLRTHPDILRTDDPEAHRQLIALNNAWEGYRRLKWRGASAPDADGGFTDFGVGCSFDDSEAERQQRQHVMDEAAKGRMNQRTLANEPS